MAFRRIRSDPSTVLWGASEADYTLPEGDLTELRNAGRAKPYGQRDEGKE